MLTRKGHLSYIVLDRFKPCEDHSVPLWLHRKWSKILNNLDQDPENVEDLCLESLFDAPDTCLDTSKYHQAEMQIVSEDQDFPGQLKTSQESEQLLELQPSRSGHQRK